VPPDPVRALRRGFDPGTLIASAAAERLGIPFRTDLLASDRRSRSQRGLGRPERLEAVARAVRWGPGIAAVRGRRILLLDDVRTTGATLTACAALLRRAGAAAVRVATLAWVE
jgi:predicted amidophosphoribosyltransferase